MATRRSIAKPRPLHGALRPEAPTAKTTATTVRNVFKTYMIVFMALGFFTGSLLRSTIRRPRHRSASQLRPDPRRGRRQGGAGRSIFMHLAFDWGKLNFMIFPAFILGAMMMIVLLPDMRRSGRAATPPRRSRSPPSSREEWRRKFTAVKPSRRERSQTEVRSWHPRSAVSAASSVLPSSKECRVIRPHSSSESSPWLALLAFLPPAPRDGRRHLATPSATSRLTERSGRTVTKADLLGKVWVASFVFTCCTHAVPADQRHPWLPNCTPRISQ